MAGNAIAGVLIELAAVGSQDQYLNLRPRLTQFRGSYRRITNFAWCPITTDFQGSASGAGRTTTVSLPRAGDLVAQMYVKMTMPTLQSGTYTNCAGFGMVKQATLDIGGYPFDTQSGRYLYAWDQLSGQAGKRLGQSVLRGTTKDLETQSQNA